MRSTVFVTKNDGQGSGMIIGPGMVLTAYHVVRGLGLPDIRFLDGQTKGGKVIWSDPTRDLALVKVNIPEGYPVASLDCGEPSAGEQVIAVGHPLGLEWVLVSGYLPPPNSERNGQISLGLPLGQGASGGPVFNEQGQVIGITLSILTKRILARKGIGYMLPARAFCKKIREKQASSRSRH